MYYISRKNDRGLLRKIIKTKEVREMKFIYVKYRSSFVKLALETIEKTSDSSKHFPKT